MVKFSPEGIVMELSGKLGKVDSWNTIVESVNERAKTAGKAMAL